MIFVSGVLARVRVSANVNYFRKDNKVEDLELKEQWRLNLLCFKTAAFIVDLCLKSFDTSTSY